LTSPRNRRKLKATKRAHGRFPPMASSAKSLSAFKAREATQFFISEEQTV
jgi:hypothetical protein